MLEHRLDREIEISATPETVFRFFTDNARWASWWGTGSTIEPKRGGQVFIRYPEGTEARGEVVEVQPPERIVFTYGFVSGKPIAVGASTVEIQLEWTGTATMLHLSHHFAEAAVRDEFVQGWRYQLSLFANAVTNELFSRAAESIDGWFAAWSEPDQATREAAVRALVTPTVRMRDRFSCLLGLPDVLPHLAAVHRFMPGIRIQRVGDVRQCQGMALVDWTAQTVSGEPRGNGANVFEFNPDGRIDSVTGFWSAAKSA